jgi:hypothetical protein
VATFGSAIANVGDWNCDGAADFVVGAPDDGLGSGRIWLYPGSRARSKPTSADIKIYAAGPDASQFGWSIAGGYDIDGDGRSDFVVGAPLSSNPEAMEGRLFVFRGRPGTQPMAPDTTLELNQPNFQLGNSVTMGDLTADGYADIVAGAPGASTGGALYGWFGGGDGTYSPTFMSESCCNGIRRFAPSRVDSAGKLGLSLIVRSAAGRIRAFPRFEIVPNQDFTNTSNFADVSFAIIDTGAPQPEGSGQPDFTYVYGLFPNVSYRWRSRSITRSPYFPHSRWLTPEGRAGGDWEIRTGGVTTAVADGMPDVLRLAPAAPNPSRGNVSFGFAIPTSVPLRLTVYDLRGRLVKTLADEPAFAGRGSRAWNGTDAHGARVPPGVYFVELRAGNDVARARFVRLD